ncbi:MAG: Hsp20/alpha crystallin family protein [Calditrichaeota bacterium]|nr:MAG: Hsp20/alpha crystallin family protein [Calditrichota bacterium]
MTKCVVSKNRVENDFDRLFTNLFNFPTYESNHAVGFSPKVNISEDSDKVLLTFELPGMDKDEIKVFLKDGMLTVSGERKFEEKKEDANLVRTEIRSGTFSRSFNLPETVLTDDVSADYKNGLLHITLTKKEEVKPKEIEVKIS